MGQEDGTHDFDVARLVQCAADGERPAWERLVAQYDRLIGVVARDGELAGRDNPGPARAAQLRLLDPLHRIGS